MAYHSDAAGVHRARHAISQLRELGITLPKGLAAAVAALDKLEAFKPPPQGNLAAAIADGADTEDLHRIALTELAEPLLRAARGKALLAAADGVMAALRAERDVIHRDLAKLAAAAIERLEKVAAVGDVPLDALVRAGRHRDAELIASAAVLEQSLDRLYVMRERLLWPRGRYPAAEITRWTDPQFAGRGFVEGLAAGGKLWFPSFTEATERAAEMLAEQQQADAAVLTGARA